MKTLVTILLLVSFNFAYAHPLIGMINKERKIPLKESNVLNRIAQARAEYLCANNVFSHRGVLNFDNDEFPLRGENLARWFPDATSTHQAFMNSPAHKEVLQNTIYQYVGIGNACGITVEEFGGDYK